MYPKARRRLAQWVDENGETRYGIRIKPFWLKKGTYAYMSAEPKDEKKYVEATISSATVLTANTIAALAVDVPGALAVFVLGVITDFFLDTHNWWRFAYGQEPGNTNLTWLERIKALFKPRNYAHGFSGVYNVLGGYLAYNAIFDKDARKLWLPWVGASGTMFSNLYVVAKENKGLEVTNHYAHFGGFAYGFLYAGLINRFWRKKTHGVGFLRRHDGKLTLMILGVIFYNGFFLKAGRERETEELEEQKRFQGGSPFGEPSELSLRQKRCDEKACDPEDTITMSGATHTTLSDPITMSGATHTTLTTGRDNLSLSKFSELDQFGYPRHDPRIDGSQKFGWYQPKKVFIGLDKHRKGVYVDPSIGSSGEIDRLSLGKSRSTPENQPQWSEHTGSTESIFVPKPDDPRYF